MGIGRLRTVLLTCFLGGIAGLLVFGPRPQMFRGDGDVVVIDYWEKWTGVERDQMKQIVNSFNETVGREKGIFVRYLSVSRVHQRSLIAIAAGTPPDVAGLWAGQVAQYASMGALEPLDGPVDVTVADPTLG